jgi:hypothetical protein
LRGDKSRLSRYWLNLGGNALKFTQRGEVRLAISVAERSERDVLLRFSVQDSGIGIPQDKLKVLFNKFSQVDASTSRKYGGTGLGLAISKRLVELMGGSIGVESVSGKGSEFHFTARLELRETSPRHSPDWRLAKPESLDRRRQPVERQSWRITALVGMLPRSVGDADAAKTALREASSGFSVQDRASRSRMPAWTRRTGFGDGDRIPATRALLLFRWNERTAPTDFSRIANREAAIAQRA